MRRRISSKVWKIAVNPVLAFRDIAPQAPTHI
ncbi:hypothetical protein V6Z12_D02G000400 [Gossypium hirsutum]